MDSNLYDLVSRSRAENDGPYTHISYFGPKCKWNVKNEDLTNFWTRYCEIASGSRGLYPLAERIQDTSPIIVRFTLLFDGQESSDLYGENFILSAVACCQRAILETFEVEEDGAELTCVVLESNTDRIENHSIVCQFVLQFPYCRTDVRDQQRNLRPHIIQYLRGENIVSKLERQPINDWDNIIGNIVDNQGNAEPCLLYRGVQHPDHVELLLTHTYGPIDQIHIDGGEPAPEYELSEIFDPTQHGHVHQGLIPHSVFAEQDIDFWIPMFLSVHFWQRLTLPQRVNDSSRIRVVNENVPIVTTRTNINVDFSEETEIQIADRLVDMLSRDRVETDHYWLDIGRALHNSCRGSQEGLRIWIRFTERSDNHTPEECEEKYLSDFSIGNNQSLKTLAWYAKADSPEAYMQWHKSWCFPYLEKAVSGIHADVATALYRIYWLDFVCASLERKLWYKFDIHRWIRLDQASELRKLISGDFMKRFMKLRTDTSMKIQESDDTNWKLQAETMVKKIGSLIGKLGTTHYKSALVKESQENFHDSKFCDKIDSNPALMGLMNGVLEVCPGYACVRDGKPEDFVSKIAPVFWHPEYDWRHPLVRKASRWLHQIFPDKSLYAYALRLFASCLFGKNSNKILPVLTGDGDNSKSMLKKAFEATFGPYCVTLPTTILTAKRANSSAPCPELAQSKGAHMAFVQEPDGDDAMRAGTIKELTGGDSFFARFLNDNGGSVVASFILFLMCNKVPVIPNCDKAIKNRVRIVPFMSTWVDDANPNEEEQYKERRFPKDSMFELQIPAMAPAFLWILVTMYEEYCREGLNEPSIISEYTNDYWAENDPYHQFIGEYIVPTYLPCEPGTPEEERERDTGCFLSSRDIYLEFAPWFRESFPGLKVPTSSAVKHELSSRWGRPSIQGWSGIRIQSAVVEL